MTPVPTPADWFGSEVRHWRHRRALSPAETARRAHTTATRLKQIETGHDLCPAALAIALDETLTTGGVLFRAWPLLHAAARLPDHARKTAFRPPPPVPGAVLPDHLLARDDVRAALADHDLGTVFHLARQWAGISYSKIAQACDMNPARVGHLAKGSGRITTYDKLTQIADALRIPGHHLGLTPRPWENPHR